MRKTLVLAMAFTVLGILTLSGQTMAGPTDLHLNWGTMVNPGQCPDGKLVVNITFKVINDGDTRVGGGFWALDSYKKHIQVWEVADDTFCADLRYVGSFTTIAGPSPQGTDPAIVAGIKGSFDGGYIATITGTLNSSPSKSAKGNIGAFNYGCLASDPGDYSTCTGLFDWVGTYFSSVSSFDQPWWGWIYRTPKNGTWINISTGNQGDITD